MIASESDAVNGLLRAMATFDATTERHLTSTAALAERVATTMALDAITVENCRVGALLHDVGLLGVDPVVLHYPAMLTTAEWELIAAHPQSGARLLLGIPSLAHIANIVRAHHERIDGTGYPDALIGNEIPLEARIIAVADAFHTMTMPLPYRDAFSTTSAVAELVGNSGSQFDEGVVAAFAMMIGVRQRRLRRA
jgi:HD-GYP domain-containing protein (c-di-GMP phosphodiesterase class II)